MKAQTIILICTILATALVAGLLYGYSCSVNPGLTRLPAREYLAAMQSINLAIQNPAFFASFMGALVLLPLSAWQCRGEVQFGFMLGAAIIYMVGVFGVTMAFNVPLNDGLAGFDVYAATPERVAAQRTAFEGPWLLWHGVRTVAAVVALLLVVVGSLYRTKPTNIATTEHLPKRPAFNEPVMPTNIAALVQAIGLTHAEHGFLQHPPASVADIVVFEQRTGFVLPQDFREFYSICNGFECNEDIFNFTPLHEIRTGDHGENWFYFAEYMISSDCWTLKKNDAGYEIISGTDLVLTTKLTDFLQHFLVGGVFEAGGLYDWREEKQTAV